MAGANAREPRRAKAMSPIEGPRTINPRAARPRAGRLAPKRSTPAPDMWLQHARRRPSWVQFAGNRWRQRRNRFAPAHELRRFCFVIFVAPSCLDGERV